MKRVKSTDPPESTRRMRPALTPEARENQLISYAVDLAEKQLMNGTASSQVITHYLKLGSTVAKLEKEALQKQNELLAAKAEALKSARNSEELYSKALLAMKKYSGNGGVSDED